MDGMGERNRPIRPTRPRGHTNATYTFAQMLLAVYVADGESGRDEFAVVYGIFFGLLTWLWFTVRVQDERQFLSLNLAYLVLNVLTGFVMAVSVFAPATAQLWIWAAVVVTWIVAGFFLGRAMVVITEEAIIVSDSLVERFGLFTIIVLGEVVVGVVNGISESERNLETIATGILALAIGFGLWWNYFDLTGRRLPREDQDGLPTWVNLHLPLTMSIAAAGAAMVSVIEHAGDPRAPIVATWVLSGSVAVTLLTVAAIVRTLQDYKQLRTVYLPASILMIVLAAGSIPLSLWRPEPIILVSTLLAVLTVAWLFAVYRWLSSEVGRNAASVGSQQGSQGT